MKLNCHLCDGEIEYIMRGKWKCTKCGQSHSVSDDVAHITLTSEQKRILRLDITEDDRGSEAIRVRMSGKRGCGKSTMAALIAHLLYEAGMDVSFNCRDKKSSSYMRAMSSKMQGERLSKRQVIIEDQT